MAGTLEAIGRSGALRGTAKEIIDAATELREQQKAKELGDVRVPIATPPKRAIESFDEVTAQPSGASPITSMDEIAPEQPIMAPDVEAEKQKFEQTQKAIEEEEAQQVQAVEDTPAFQQLASTPTAQNMLVEVAKANGWIENVGGVDTISNRNLQVAQQIIGTNLKLQKDLNEAALNDISGQVSQLEQALIDPKIKPDQMAQVQTQLEQAKNQRTSVLNHINTLDREIQREVATREPKAPDQLDEEVPDSIKKVLGIPLDSDITYKQAEKAGFKVISSQPTKTGVVSVGDNLKLINMENGNTIKNLGKIPTKPDPKREANERAEGLKRENRLSKSKIISEKAAKALNETGFLTTGFIGSMLSGIRGTSAFDLDKTIDTIKANLGFEELAAMRAASPTGGALGQIAVRELEFLQSALDALDIGQSEDQLREALTNVKVHYDNIIENIEKAKSATEIPAGFTERVVSKTGKIGFKNPKTNEIFVR